MNAGPEISTCLWFESAAEEAAAYYVSLFPNSRIVNVTRLGESGDPAGGAALTVDFELAGRAFMALNGGPHDAFNDAHSMVVRCDTQDEIDRLWAALLKGGGQEKQCGWLKDRYGLSWQIVPAALAQWLNSGEPEAAARVMDAVMGMVKLDIAALEAAYRSQ